MGLTPPTSLIKTNKFMVMSQTPSPRKGGEADGQAMEPFESFRSNLGVAEGALGELSGPTTRVSSTTLFRALNGIKELFVCGLPEVGGTLLSERWPSVLSCGKSFCAAACHSAGPIDRGSGDRSFRDFFVVLAWLFRASLRVLALEKSSDNRLRSFRAIPRKMIPQ